MAQPRAWSRTWHDARRATRAGVPRSPESRSRYVHEHSRHRRRRFHRRQLRPPDPRTPPRREGHGARQAHLRRQQGLPGRPGRPGEPRRGGHRRRRRGGPAGGGRRRRRPLRRRVPQRQLPAGPLPLHPHQPGGNLHPPGVGAPPQGALPPRLHRRGLRRPRARRPGQVHPDHPVQPVVALLLLQGRLGPAGAGLGAVLRGGGHDLQLLEQLRALPARREVHPPSGHQPHRRGAAQALRRRGQCA